MIPPTIYDIKHSIRSVLYPTMSSQSTLSNSTPLSDWFANVNHMYNIVQKQIAVVKKLQERIIILESQLSGVNLKNRIDKIACASAVVVDAPALATIDPTVSKQKRGRKPNTSIDISKFLKEGEQVIARIPLGDHRFDEQICIFKDKKLVLEDGQSFDHPTTMVSSLAKMLEYIEERSSECSNSLNGWMICSVIRNGKRISLEKLKSSVSTPVSITIESADDEHEGVDSE